jgi:hypothetical protein
MRGLFQFSDLYVYLTTRREHNSCLRKTFYIVGGLDIYAKDPHFRKLILFYEYFNGDTGKGCGAR